MRGEGAVGRAERVQFEVWRLIGKAYEKRRTSGLNQSELARRLGVPRGQVCLWLIDRERMTLKAAARLADAMNYDLDVRLVRRTTRGPDHAEVR